MRSITWRERAAFDEGCMCCECSNFVEFDIVSQFKSAATTFCEEDGYIVIARNAVGTGDTCPADKIAGSYDEGVIAAAEENEWEDGGGGSSSYAVNELDASYSLGRFKLRLAVSLDDGLPTSIGMTAGYRRYTIHDDFSVDYEEPETSTLEWVMDTDTQRIFQSPDWIEQPAALENEGNYVELFEPLGLCIDAFDPATLAVLSE